jgi:hypothetical protein
LWKPFFSMTISISGNNGIILGRPLSPDPVQAGVTCTKVALFEKE